MQESKIETFSIIIKPSYAKYWIYNMLYTKFEKL
jgi:hypothetical protein